MITHRLGDCSVSGDLSVFHEHVSSGDSDVCELQVSYESAYR